MFLFGHFLSSIDGSFSIAMLNTQRISQVPCVFFKFLALLEVLFMYGYKSISHMFLFQWTHSKLVSPKNDPVKHEFMIPICSMYAIFTTIYPINGPVL